MGDESIRRILIVKWSALGDVTISSAIFEDVRNAFPGAVIDLDTTVLQDSRENAGNLSIFPSVILKSGGVGVIVRGLRYAGNETAMGRSIPSGLEGMNNPGSAFVK